MNKPILLEIIAASLDDARAAVDGGADRLELCSALALGGLTPSIGTLEAIKSEVEVQVMCMVRPREGGMAYTEGEFTVMLRDAEALLKAGADGLVFGFLSADGEVDIDRSRRFLDVAAHAADGRAVETVFHRAFDVVAHPERALEEIVSLGITRILTSGRAPEAIGGTAEIRRYVEQAGGRIQILPGGGIDLFTVERIVSESAVDQVHLYLTDTLEDRSVTRNPRIYFGAHVPSSELEVRRVSPDRVRRVRSILDRIA